MPYSDKLGAYLAVNHPGSGPAYVDEKGEAHLPEDFVGKPPSEEEVANFILPKVVAIDHAAEVEAAVAKAKAAGNATTKSAGAITAVEALNARVAALEKRLGI